MAKKVLIVIASIVLVVFAVIAYGYFSITGSSTVSAQLRVESGNVLVNDAVTTGKVLLKKGDSIKTSDDGKATVILYESIVISLESGTKITLDDLTKAHPQVSQEGGETWNKFTKLAGVKEYSIKAGNSVASVRGTAFSITEDKIVVAEGEVEYEKNGNDFNVTEDEVVETVGDQPVEREANAEEMAKIKENMEKTIEELKYIRNLEIEKQGFLLNKLKEQFGFTDEDIKQTLNDADEGIVDVDELLEQSPVKIESLQKIADLTKEIQKIKQSIGQTAAN